jgi:signal recognition particle GTPase
VCYSRSQLSVPGTVFASIWNKASQYLDTESTVVQAPSVESGVRRFKEFINFVTITTILFTKDGLNGKENIGMIIN